MQHHRITLRDRGWTRFTTTRVIGPLTGLDPDRLKALLVAVHSRHPQTPALSLLDRRRGRTTAVGSQEFAALLPQWVQVVERSEVTPTGTPTAGDLARVISRLPETDLPLQVFCCAGVLGVRTCHALGDGATITPIVLALAAGDESRLEAALVAPLRRGPVTTALLRHFGTHPGRLIAAARTVLPISAPGSDPAAAQRHGVALAETTIGAPVLTALRQQRDRSGTGASVAAVVMTEAIGALRDAGLRSAGVNVMMDCRRYLGEAPAVPGNFATGPYLAVPDRLDATAFGTAMQRSLERGTPLLLLGLGVTLMTLRGGRPKPLASVRHDPVRPSIMLTHQGRPALASTPLVERSPQLPTSGPGVAPYVVAPTPSGPEGVTMGFLEGPLGLHVCVTADAFIAGSSTLASVLQSLERRLSSLADVSGVSAPDGSDRSPDPGLLRSASEVA
ncbi:MAG: hypothetical protein WKF57_05650 [Nakamurella sp.]